MYVWRTSPRTGRPSVSGRLNTLNLGGELEPGLELTITCGRFGAASAPGSGPRIRRPRGPRRLHNLPPKLQRSISAPLIGVHKLFALARHPPPHCSSPFVLAGELSPRDFPSRGVGRLIRFLHFRRRSFIFSLGVFVCFRVCPIGARCKSRVRIKLICVVQLVGMYRAYSIMSVYMFFCGKGRNYKDVIIFICMPRYVMKIWSVLHFN